MNLFRHTDPNYPFIWGKAGQPAARWNAEGQGPVHYFATTPDGAWAEWLRHEEITEPEDLEGLKERAMWIVEVDDPSLARPALPTSVLVGGLDSYDQCRHEADRIRDTGAIGLRAPSAALEPGGATRYYVDGVQKTEQVDSEVIALFERRPDLRAFLCAVGRPLPHVLKYVRPL